MSGALTESNRAFVALVRELRSSGAMRVRDGGLEVVFAEAPEKPEAEGRTPPRVTYSKSEEDRLARAEKRLGELEELGVV